MTKRLLAGLAKGILVGGLLALLLIRGLGISVFDGAATAYLMAAATGVLTGLIAGRPIWAKGAKVEASLKAFAGAALGTAVLFALRRWVHFDLDLTAWDAGRGAVGALPAVSLPVVSTVLAVIFDLDNTGDRATEKKARMRVEQSARSRAPSDAAQDPDATENAKNRQQVR